MYSVTKYKELFLFEISLYKESRILSKKPESQKKKKLYTTHKKTTILM
jgi:hypothetical protein